MIHVQVTGKDWDGEVGILHTGTLDDKLVTVSEEGEITTISSGEHTLPVSCCAPETPVLGNLTGDAVVIHSSDPNLLGPL